MLEGAYLSNVHLRQTNNISKRYSQWPQVLEHSLKKAAIDKALTMVYDLNAQPGGRERSEMLTCCLTCHVDLAEDPAGLFHDHHSRVHVCLLAYAAAHLEP